MLFRSPYPNILISSVANEIPGKLAVSQKNTKSGLLIPEFCNTGGAVIVTINFDAFESPPLLEMVDIISLIEKAIYFYS